MRKTRNTHVGGIPAASGAHADARGGWEGELCHGFITCDVIDTHSRTLTRTLWMGAGGLSLSPPSSYG